MSAATIPTRLSALAEAYEHRAELKATRGLGVHVSRVSMREAHQRVGRAEADAFGTTDAEHARRVRELLAALPQQPPQPLDRVQDPADEGGHVEQRDHAQRGED